MISDYVDPQSYTKQEWNEEVKLINIIKREIKELETEFEYLEIKNLTDLKKSLKKYNKNEVVIFNWCEFLEEKEDTEYLVTEYLESQSFIFTGANTKCLKLTESKEKTKEKLTGNNIPTPKYVVIKKGAALSNIGLSYPLMLKLENRHSSAGITNENVVYNYEQLCKVSERLFSDYHTNVLVEEFIDGQEYTVTAWGNGKKVSCIYITKEIYKDSKVSVINTESSKFFHNSADEKNLISKVVDKKNDKKNIIKINEIVVNSYRALNFFDYGRFELREKAGNFYVIDCNPNPWIGLSAVLFKGTKKLGYNYGETILQICKFAVQRYMK